MAPPANPDASRSAPGRRRRWRRARAGAGATAVSARHGPGGRCGCVGSAVPRRAAPRGGRHRNRRGRSSDDRDRSGCTARPAHDNARTGTGGRDGRPVARLPGRTPEERQWPAACDVQARSRRHKLHSHPATWRGCRARRPDLSCHAMGRHRARLPLGHAEVLPQPARPAGATPHHLPAAGQAAALQGGCLAGPSSRATTTADRCRPVASLLQPEPALHRAWDKTATSPPEKSGS